MKVTYTVPDYSSLNDNGIKDFSVVNTNLEELRMVHLTGKPVRIEIDGKDKWVESQYGAANKDDTISLENYKELFGKLTEFFYGTAYLFGMYEDGKLTVYDVYTNSNYLSTRDLDFLKENFGLPVAQVLAQGYFNYNEFIKFLAKQDDPENVYLLPAMYLNDQRNWVFEETLKKKTHMEFGEKKTWNTWNGSNSSSSSTWNNSSSTWSGSSSSSTTASTATTTAIPAKTAVSNFSDNNKVFEVTSKDERHSIFEQTLKNIEKTNEKALGVNANMKKWWNERGKKFAFLYSIYTLPNTRKLVYDFVEKECTVFSEETVSELFASVFTEMFELDHFNKLGFFFNYEDFIYIPIMFKEEFDAFYTFYKAENKEDILTPKIISLKAAI